MRIALVGPAYPDRGGGARHTTELAHRLTAAGHNVVIESWRAQPRSQHHPEGQPYPRTYRRLARYRPDSWLAAGRRLRSADLVILVLVTPAQVPFYLSLLTRLTLGPKHPRTVLICHRLPRETALARSLLSHADTVIVHSAAQAAEARELACDVPIVVARIPPYIPATAAPIPVPAPRHPDSSPETYWAAYLQALRVSS